MEYFIFPRKVKREKFWISFSMEYWNKLLFWLFLRIHDTSIVNCVSSNLAKISKFSSILFFGIEDVKILYDFHGSSAFLPFHTTNVDFVISGAMPLGTLQNTRKRVLFWILSLKIHFGVLNIWLEVGNFVIVFVNGG